MERLGPRRLPDTPHSIVLMGGAALVLLYAAREATKDTLRGFSDGGMTPRNGRSISRGF
jgi:hypothetical protein